MFCPKCNAEYRPGYTQCADCHVALVDTLPDEEQQQIEVQPPSDDSFEVVTVFESGNHAKFAMAKDLLETAGIPFISGGDILHGTFHSHFGSAMGLPRIQVNTRDALRAKELLRGLDDIPERPFEGQDDQYLPVDAMSKEARQALVILSRIGICGVILFMGAGIVAEFMDMNIWRYLIGPTLLFAAACGYYMRRIKREETQKRRKDA